MQDEGPHILRNGVSRGYYAALFRWRTNTVNRTSYRVIRPYQDNLQVKKEVVIIRDQGRTNHDSRNRLHLRQWNLEWEEQALGIMRNWKN
jgi:hypothetical protein